GRFPCPGAAVSLGSPDNLLPLIGADLVKTARNVKFSVIWDAGVRSTRNLSPMLSCCSTPEALQDQTRYLITTRCKESNINPALARTSMILVHGSPPNLLIAALRDVLDGLGCWSVSGNLTNQGLRAI
ncbi:MAG: hypothetical protein ACKPKO_37100, partial [Candidatus Fonsibacter sp.]